MGGQLSTPKAAIVEVPLTRGLRQDVAPPFVPLGGLVKADNLEFDATGTLQRREGITSLGTSIYSFGTTYAGPTRRFGLGTAGQPLLFTDSATYAEISEQDKLSTATVSSSSLRATVRGSTIIHAKTNAMASSGYSILFSDCARYQTMTLHVYVASDIAGLNGLYLTVINDSGVRTVSGMFITNSVSANVPPHVIVLSTGIAFLIWADTTVNIKYLKIDLTGSTLIPNIASAANLITNLDSSTTYQTFDVATTSDASNAQTRFVLVYAQDIAGTRNAVIVTYDSTPSVVSGPTTWTSSGGGAAMRMKSLGVTGAISTTTKIFAAGVDTVGTNLQTWTSSYTLGSISKASESSVPVLNWVQTAVGRMGSNDTAMVCYGGPTVAGSTINSVGRMRIGTIRSDGTFANGAGSYAIATYGPASKWFTDTAGNIFIIGVFTDQATVQRHLMLFQCGTTTSETTLTTPTPVARIANGLSVTSPYSGLPSVPRTSTNLFTFPAVINNAASALLGQSLCAWTIQTNGPDRFLNFNAHGSTHIAGGAPLTYDGQRLVETGFFSYPDVSATSYTRSAAGGSIAQGIYSYRFVWEWFDSNGNRHQSQASPAVTVDMSSGTYVANTNSVAWSIAPLHATRKVQYIYAGYDPTTYGADNVAAPRLVMYRTAAGGSKFYRCSLGVETGQINPIAMLSLTDTLVDSSITSNPGLFSDAGILAMDAGPPTLHMTTHGLRVWGTNAENPEQVWASKLFEDGEAMSPSLALTITIPGCGRVNGLAGQDDKLYALCTEGIWIASYGDGPNNIGQGAFPDPVFITATATCDNPRGVITSTEGIYFSGPGRWGTTIYMIRRGDGSPVDIGKRVRTELAACPIVRSSTERIDKARIDFLCVDSDTAPSACKILSYHYDNLDEEQIGQWTVHVPFGGADGGEAIMASGAATFVATSTHLGKQSSTGGLVDAGTSFYYMLQTADIRPFGLLGYGEVHSANVLATSKAGATLTIAASYDQGNTYPDSTENTLSTTTGYPEIRRWEPPTKKLANGFVRYALGDHGASLGPAAIQLHALALEAMPLGSIIRVIQGGAT